jgi:DNA-binding protein HU-beta
MDQLCYITWASFMTILNHGGTTNYMPAKSDGKKAMNQSQIINHFAEKFEIKRAQAKEFFVELSSLASKEVKKSGEFVLPGFGKLVLAKRKAREGRNPATGEPIKIPAKTTLKFRVGKAMKDSVVPAKK